jgi:hypothetical protein
MKQGTLVRTWKTKSGKQAILRVVKKSDFEDLLGMQMRLSTRIRSSCCLVNT